MADPISVTGLVIAIGGLVQALMNHASNIKDARKEIQDLTSELFALKGVLEHIKCQQEAALMYSGSHQPSKYQTQEFLRMLVSTNELLEALGKHLKPAQSRFGQSIQRMTWSFKREEVQKQIARIERVKTSLVVVMTADNVTSLQDILSEMSLLGKTLQEEREQNEVTSSQPKNEYLLNWLAPVKPYSTHAKALTAHLQGTGNWFLQGPLREFSKDSMDEGQVLWLQGKSGSGKTTLMAYVIEHLITLHASSQDVGIACFYISFDELASQDPPNILGSFAEQLAPKSPQILEEYSIKFAKELKEKYPRQVSLSDLMEPFVQCTAHLSSIFLCVDGVNESEHATEVISLLSHLVKQCNNIRLLVSSTGSFGKQFHGVSTLIEIEMDAKDVDRDIRRYIDTTMSTNSNLKTFSELFKNDARNAILSRSHGMFRYAQWQIASLAVQRTGRGARKVLSSMPQNLNESYERVLARIPADSPDRLLLQRTLLWLSYATRPLDLLELADAVVLEDGDRDIDSDSRLPSPEILVDIAQGLLVYEKDWGLVSLAHSSIKTFLTSTWIQTSRVADFALDEVHAHNTLMKKCLTYLCFPKLGDGAYLTDWTIETMDRYPLLAYATHNWIHHIKTVAEEDWKQIQSFLATRSLPEGGNYCRWMRSVIKVQLSPPLRTIRKTSPLYYAASYGFTGLVKAILEFDQSIDLEEHGGRYGSTALQVACYRRQREVSKLLVEAGAEPFSYDVGSHTTAFTWASLNGWVKLTELMLMKNPGKKDEIRAQTPGFWSSSLASQESIVGQDQSSPRNFASRYGSRNRSPH